MKKSRLIFLMLSAFLIVLTLVFSSSADNTKTYKLYKNDTMFSLPEYPAISIDSEIHVPTSFFIGFDNISYEYSKSYQSFYFMNRKTSRYFSFSFNSKDIIVDGVYTKKTFPIENSTIYLPLSYCADILSLNIEIREENNVVSIRLTDGTQKLGFDELIKLLNSSGPLGPDDIENPDNPIVSPGIDTPVYSNREKVYLMFEVEKPEYFKQTIDTLTSFGEKATVFFTNEQMLAYPQEVIHTLVSGSGVGIIPNGIDCAVANDTLKLITNTKTRAILSNDDGVVPSPLLLCKPDIASDSYTNLDSWSAAQSLYNDARLLEDPYILVTVRENNHNFILALLGFLSNDENIQLVTIN